MKTEAMIVTAMVFFTVVWSSYSYMNKEESEEVADDKVTFPPDASFECFIHDDLERCWILYVPDTLETNSTVPLIVHKLVNHTLQEYPIDSNRIYATGWSNGCGMSQSLANRQSDVFAAVACMSMYYLDESDDPNYSPIPIMEIHGTLDPIVPYTSTVATGIIFAGQLWDTGALQNLYTWKDKNECSGTLPEYSEVTTFYNIQGFTDCTNNAEVSKVQATD